jgi:hypothetical protein
MYQFLHIWIKYFCKNIPIYFHTLPKTIKIPNMHTFLELGFLGGTSPKTKVLSSSQPILTSVDFNQTWMKKG